MTLAPQKNESMILKTTFQAPVMLDTDKEDPLSSAPHHRRLALPKMGPRKYRFFKNGKPPA